MSFIRRVLQVALLLVTLVVGAAAAAIIVSQTAWFRDYLRGLIIRQANRYLNGQLSIGRLGGNLFFGLEFEDLGVTQGGERVIAVKSAGLEYSVIQFVSGNLVVDHIRLDRPTVFMKKEGDRWNLTDLVKHERREKERTGPARPVSIGEVGISDGTFIVQDGSPALAEAEEADGVAGTSGRRETRSVAVPREIRKVDARFSFKYEPVRYTVDIAHLSLRGRDPEVDLNDLSGKISERDGSVFLENVAVRTAQSSLRVDGEIGRYATAPVLDVKATSNKLDMPEMGRLFPSLRGIALQPSFRVSAKGPLDRVAFDFAARSSSGDASGQVTADLKGREHAIAGEVHLGNLDLAPILRTAAARTRLSGLARVDVRFPAEPGHGPVAGRFSVSAFDAQFAGYSAREIEASGRVAGRRVYVDRGKAVAYGAAAIASGTVEPGVRGPGGRRGLAIDLHGSVAGLDLRRLPRSLKMPELDSRLAFDYQVAGVGADLRGDARLRPSTLAGAQLANGTTGSFSSVGPTIEYAAEGAIAGLDVQRYGRGLKIAAISTDRFKSDLNGRFSARGSGTTLPTLTLDATASLNSSTLDGVGIPLADVEAHLANGGGRFKADGGFFNFDPSRFTGRSDTRGSVAGRVNATVDLARLSGPITPDSVTASGEVALDRSKVGGLEIAAARLSGDFANSAGRIREATITATDLGLRASGDLALGKSGSSNLAYHVESPNLQTVGKLVGQPLQGFLTLDGRVTGNGTDLRAQGDLRAGNVKFGSADALTAQSRYDVSLPDLDAARAQVKADTTVAFLRFGGQDVDTLRATTTYANRQVAFDVTAEQAVRSARLVGSLLLHPDHQEVHLTNLDFRTQGLDWALAPGSKPAVQYGGGNVTVKGVHLVSGRQSLLAEGTIGKSDSNLRAALTDVNLATLDTWLVGDRRFAGTLNAFATVTGPMSALAVSGDFSVDGGSFRDFRYETLGGNLAYSRDRIAVDMRLSQGPQTWITAKGTLPVAFFRPTNPDGTPAPGANSPVDLTIKSSPIDLGLVQGFTSAITKATGTLLADVRLAGTAGTPQVSGQVSLQNGAFTVEPARVSYKAVNGRIELQPDRAVIQQLNLADEHDRTASVTGELGLRGRSLGALKLKVNSRKFEVLDNDLAHITLNSDLTISGDLRAPRVEGQLGINTGEIYLDKVLELTGSSAYSTTPESAEAINGPQRAAGGAPGQPLPAGSAIASGQQAPPAGAVGMAGGAAPAGAGARPAGGAGQPPARGAAASAPRQQAASPASVFDAAVLDVTVKVPDDLVVKGQDIQPGNTPIGLGNVNVTLGGDLRVTKRASVPNLRLVGVVNTVRGTYDFQGRRFDIQRGGRVRFEGLVPMDPKVDITATRLIAGVEARVQVTGSVRKPELVLSSNPPLEQADILSLIIFNQPASELGTGQQVSLAERAGALATGFVAGKLADSIGKALNLDVFEISTEATASGGQGATVTVGQQVGRNLFFKVVQGVGAENLSQFVLDYQLTNFLRFETTMTQGGTATRSLVRRVEQSGADLIFFFSY